MYWLGKYDGPDTLFYLDPPYWGCETDYGRDVFARDDFAEMATRLAAIEGKFLLSLNDCEGVRDTFGAFTFEEVSPTYTAGTKSAKAVNELVISKG